MTTATVPTPDGAPAGDHRSGIRTDVRLHATEPIARTAVRRPMRPPSLITCGVLICSVKIALRVAGFGPVLAWIRARARPVTEQPAGGVVEALNVDRAVATAAALYPGRALCLEQSLVLYFLLRRRGLAASFKMGVQPLPFAAHAWVEYDGEIISDTPEHVAWFAPLPDIAP